MKIQRQKKILELIARQPVETQEDLALRLEGEGFRVTQATVSRDIKELRLIKVSSGNNRYRYAVSADIANPGPMNQVQKAFADSVRTLESSENLIVIKTSPGAAQTVALAIDTAGPDEIIGTVAGDDTVLAVVKPMSAVPHLLEKLRSYLPV